MQRTSNGSPPDRSTTIPHGVHSTARAHARGWLPVSPSATILETPAFPPPCARSLVAHISDVPGIRRQIISFVVVSSSFVVFRLHLPRIVHPNEAHIGALAQENVQRRLNPAPLPARSNNQLPSGASLTALSERDDRGRSGRRCIIVFGNNLLVLFLWCACVFAYNVFHFNQSFASRQGLHCLRPLHRRRPPHRPGPAAVAVAAAGGSTHHPGQGRHRQPTEAGTT